jgi:cell division inhibitor SepF
MAGVLRKTMVYLGLLEQGDEEYDDDLLDAAEPEPASVRRLGADDARTRTPAYVDAGRESQGALALRPDTRVRVQEPPTVAAEAGPAYKITTFHPSSYNDARAIGEHYREGVPVIMDLSDMEEKDAKRLVDFAAGLTFGLRGSLHKVTNRVFLLSPSNVEVSADYMARIREGGFFNQS